MYHLSEKRLVLVNLIILGYFCLIYLLHSLKVDFALVDFVVELLTIPFLLAQVVFLVIGLRFLFKKKKPKFTTFLSTAALAICAVATLREFF